MITRHHENGGISLREIDRQHEANSAARVRDQLLLVAPHAQKTEPQGPG
jgi:hypothetical protein